MHEVELHIHHTTKPDGGFSRRQMKCASYKVLIKKDGVHFEAFKLDADPHHNEANAQAAHQYANDLAFVLECQYRTRTFREQTHVVYVEENPI